MTEIPIIRALARRKRGEFELMARSFSRRIRAAGNSALRPSDDITGPRSGRAFDDVRVTGSNPGRTGRVQFSALSVRLRAARRPAVTGMEEVPERRGPAARGTFRG